MEDIVSAAPNMRVSLKDTLTRYALNHITELDRMGLSPDHRLTIFRIIIGCCKNVNYDFQIKVVKSEGEKNGQFI